MNVLYLLILDYTMSMLKGAEIDKWSILSTKIDYVRYNRKELPTNTARLSSTEGKCQKRYTQLQTEV